MRGMIAVMTMGWRRGAAMMLAAVAVAGVSGCGSDGGGEAESKPSASASSAGPTLEEAVGTYQSDLSALRTDGCPSPCGPELVEVYQNSQMVRKQMNASGAAPGVFTEAYALMDDIQRGFISRGGQDTEAARALVLGPANDLDQWLKDNPIK
ncbi:MULTISPECIES: hypothetical protein [unclassified Streptomyces]|uniref:hypothetical protein n=1 Tax=unclassified Streptomyces TaxID=2593676 RepID=UPI0035E1DD19